MMWPRTRGAFSGRGPRCKKTPVGCPADPAPNDVEFPLYARNRRLKAGDRESLPRTCGVDGWRTRSGRGEWRRGGGPELH